MYAVAANAAEPPKVLSAPVISTSNSQMALPDRPSIATTLLSDQPPLPAPCAKKVLAGELFVAASCTRPIEARPCAALAIFGATKPAETMPLPSAPLKLCELQAYLPS